MVIINLIRDSLKTNKKINILLIFQITMVFILICFSFGFLHQTNLKTLQLKNTTKTLYKIDDNFLGEAEKKFFQQPDNVYILKSFYKWLSQNSEFDYIVANHQSVYVYNSKLPSKFEYGVSTGNNAHGEINSLQVNSKFLTYFNITAEEGRLFNKEDYNLKSSIPILLGSEFKEYFKLHDHLQLSYLSKHFDGEVIGFINDDCYYNDSYNLRKLDQYIILPSFGVENLPQNSEDKSFDLKLYLDKCGGLLATDMPANYLQRIITEKCYELDIIPYQIEGTISFYPSIWGMEGEKLQKLINMLIIIITISYIFCISISTASKIRLLKKDYAVYIANGFGMGKIFISVVAEIALINFIAFIIAVFGNQIFGPRIPISQLSIFYLAITLASIVYPYKLLTKIDISKTLRGDS